MAAAIRDYYQGLCGSRVAVSCAPADTGIMGDSDSEHERNCAGSAMAWLDQSPDPRVDFAWLSTFTYEGRRIPLMDRQRGIRKPAGMEAALAIRTTFTPPGQLPPYNDAIGPDGLQRYKYRGTDPDHPENVALRRAFEQRLPSSGSWVSPQGCTSRSIPCGSSARIASDLRVRAGAGRGPALHHTGTAWPSRRSPIRRADDQSATAPAVFRTQVLLAYDGQLHHLPAPAPRAARCGAHHRDGRPNGEPVVPNGLACARSTTPPSTTDPLAFDLTSRSTSAGRLEEVDGWMLKGGHPGSSRHGLAELPRIRAATARPRSGSRSGTPILADCLRASEDAATIRSTASSAVRAPRRGATVQPQLLKRRAISAIALDVGRELVPPPLRVVLRSRRMLRAAVPEAAIDEDDDLAAGEDDVAATSEGRLGPVVDPVPVAECVQSTSDLQLELRVSTLLPAHAIARRADRAARASRHGEHVFTQCSVERLSTGTQTAPLQSTEEPTRRLVGQRRRTVLIQQSPDRLVRDPQRTLADLPGLSLPRDGRRGSSASVDQRRTGSRDPTALRRGRRACPRSIRPPGP